MISKNIKTIIKIGLQALNNRRIKKMRRDKLAFHEGKYWYLESPGQIRSLKDSSLGKTTWKYREVEGDELRKQLEAIEYFRKLGVCE